MDEEDRAFCAADNARRFDEMTREIATQKPFDVPEDADEFEIGEAAVEIVKDSRKKEWSGRQVSNLPRLGGNQLRLPDDARMTQTSEGCVSTSAACHDVDLRHSPSSTVA